MPFRVADGHNNPGGLTVVTPQPRCIGIQYPVRRYSAANTAHDHGTGRVEWLYDYMTTEQFAAMRQLLGLDESAPSAPATIETIQNDHTTFAVYNVEAHDPRPDEDFKFEGGKYRDVVWRFFIVEAVEP